MHLSPAQVQRLLNYRYQGVDLSLTSRYLLQPYWTWLVQLFPLWMAPNTITLLGFLALVINLLCLIGMAPTLYGTYHNDPLAMWMYFSFAFGLFFYMSMDAIDGKQARRTFMSGPLGELFDHCADALNVTLGVILSASALGIEEPSLVLITALMSSMAVFYVSTWEEYHTGVLYLGIVSGPVEGILSLVSVYLVSGTLGGRFWSLFVFDTVTARDMTQLLLHATVLFSIVSSLINVRRQYTFVGPFTYSLLGLVPLIVLLVPAYLVYATAMHRPLVLYYTIPLLLTMGLLFSRLVGAIILAHVTGSTFPFTGMLLRCIPLWTLLYASPAYEINWMWACFTFHALDYVYFCTDCILGICSCLNVTCFTVPPDRLDRARQAMAIKKE